MALKIKVNFLSKTYISILLSIGNTQIFYLASLKKRIVCPQNSIKSSHAKYISVAIFFYLTKILNLQGYHEDLE